MIYYFLVEKVHIIRTINTSRFKSKLWLFNFFGVICKSTVLMDDTMSNLVPRPLCYLGRPELRLVSVGVLSDLQQANCPTAVSHTSTRRASALLE
jgi:hypothetical protein